MNVKKFDEHNKLIMDQFSKQAVPFTKKVPAHSNEEAFNLIIKTVGISQDDHVLDVACGPGMMSASIAKVAKHVTGIDLVPAMIEQAKILQKEKSLTNMDWHLGNVMQLPFEDASFSAVVTRFSFHHFLDPQAVLKEMLRVLKPGGKIGIVDVFTTSDRHSDLYNLIEKLRDESHVYAFSFDELESMMIRVRVKKIRSEVYRLEISLEQQMKASFPKPGDADKINRLVSDDQAKTQPIVTCRRGEDIYFFYPIAIIAGEKN